MEESIHLLQNAETLCRDFSSETTNAVERFDSRFNFNVVPRRR